MIIRPEHAAEVAQAREHAHASKMRALNKGLVPSFVGHAFVAEAMKLWLDCDNDRANALASGFMVLAFAENRAGDDTGAIIAEYILRRSTNDPKLTEDLVALSGLARAAMPGPGAA